MCLQPRVSPGHGMASDRPVGAHGAARRVTAQRHSHRLQVTHTEEDVGSCAEAAAGSAAVGAARWQRGGSVVARHRQRGRCALRDDALPASARRLRPGHAE
jgi:hypothetical protein